MMKKNLAIYSLLMVFCCSALLANGQQTGLATAEKQFSKTFDAVAGKQLRITNAYGNIVIKTWAKPQAAVVIAIKAFAKTKSAASGLAGSVDIHTASSRDVLSCSTIVARKLAGQDTTTVEEKCSINYTVYMPASMGLSINNQFGDITLPDFSGNVDVTESFGTLTAGVLANASFKLSMSSLFIKAIYTGDIWARAFDVIKIDTVYGEVGCGLSAGKLLEVGLANGHYGFTLKSDNIHTANFHLPKNFDGSVSADAVFSTVVNHSGFALAEDTAAKKKAIAGVPGPKQPLNDSPHTKMLDKKLMELKLLKKLQHYHGAAGNKSITVQLAVSFCKLTFD